MKKIGYHRTGIVKHKSLKGILMLRRYTFSIVLLCSFLTHPVLSHDATHDSTSESYDDRYSSLTEFFAALREGDLCRVRDILKREPSIDLDSARDLNGLGAIHICAQEGHVHILEYLINKIGVLVDRRCVYGKTALHYAILHYKQEATSFLLANNASTELADPEGYMPLHRAVQKRDTVALEALLLRGADPCVKAWNGMTPLHCASIGTFLVQPDAIASELIELLVSYSLEGDNQFINERDMRGNTALHYAIDTCLDFYSVPLLIHLGADISLRNNEGLTPLLLASIRLKNASEENKGSYLSSIQILESAFLDEYKRFIYP